MPKIYDIQPIESEKPASKKSVPVTSVESDVQSVPIRRDKTVSQTPSQDVVDTTTDLPVPHEDEVLARLASRENKKPIENKATAAVEEPSGPKPSMRKLLLPLIAIGLIVLVGATWFGGYAISRADIELVTASSYLPFSFAAEFRKEVNNPDAANSLYPLEILHSSATSTHEYPATGEGEVKSKARGMIEIVNSYNTQPQVLIEKTRFISENGKLFRLTQKVTIPGGTMVAGKLVPGTIRAEVLADQAGPEYNIKPTSFSIPGFQGSPRYEKFSGVSRQAFSGGAIGHSKFVKDEDLRQAEEDAAKQVFESLKSAVLQSLPENFRLTDGASRIDVKHIEASLKAGDAGEKFSVTIFADITALVFDETHIIAKAKESMPKGPEVFTPKLDISYKVTQANFDSGDLKINIQGAVSVKDSIDPVALKRTVLGKNGADLKREILAIPGIKEARIRFWPRWVQKMPSAPEKIKVTIR